MKRGLYLLSGLVLFSNASFAANLTGAELQALVDKPLSWKSGDGKMSGKTVYKSGGIAVLSESTIPKIKKDIGKWRIQGEEFCVTWKKIRKGKEGCFTIERQPDGSLKTSTNILIMAP